MTEPNQSSPWARPPDGAPEQPVSYPPPPTANWAYQPVSAPPQGPQGPQGPQRSLTPIIAIIVAAVLLLCAGTAVAGVMIFNQARDAVTTPDPTPPPTEDPTEAPPADPTPGRTGDPFQLPSDLPGLPGLDDLIPTGAAVTAGPEAKVTYEVTGEDSAAISYTEAGTTPKADRNATLPWKKEFTLGRDTPLLSVSGIHFGTRSSELTCRILLDGREVVKKSATGTAVTASCMQFVVVS